MDVILQNSDLTERDKMDFLKFIENFSEETTKSLEEAFSNNPKALDSYWQTLKTKLTFIEMVQNEKDVSDEQKHKIIDQITQMNSEELTVFMNTLLQMQEAQDPTKVALDLLKAQKKAHQAFMQEAKKTTPELHNIHKTLQTKKRC